MDKAKFQSIVREYIEEFSAPKTETIKKSELQSIIQETIRVILKEALQGSLNKKRTGPYTVYVNKGRLAGKVVFATKDEETGYYYYRNPDTGTDEYVGTDETLDVQKRKLSDVSEGQVPYADLKSAWSEDRSGEYVQINPDGSAWYIAMGRAKQQIAPKGAQNVFQLIAAWMKKNAIIFNIWMVDDHGGVELYNRQGKPLGGLTENVNEITVTSAVDPINLPASGPMNWVSGKGGSKRGVEGSPTGMTLTNIGAEDMKKKQDPVY